jgi:prolyl-tRNA synthetase
MPIRWSQTLVPTLRQAPSDAEVPSHRLMLRAGLIRKLGSGSYSYLPLGLRALQKVQQIIRQEMNAIVAAEVLLPALQPIDLWERTGRRTAYGDNLFTLEDRHGRTSALGPTHEEVITELVGAYAESYRDLPLRLYQIQTKFRDEFRPRFGVLRSREFQMKDAYSFHLAMDGPGGLDACYDDMYAAYEKIFTRCGLRYQVVEAEAGPIGGNASHEFMVPSPTGEDTILRSDSGAYAANVEKAQTGPRPVGAALTPFSRVACDARPPADPTGDLEPVHTPDTPGIDDVIAFFKKQLKTKLKPQNMLKTIVFQAPEARWVLAVVRGDHEVNEAKLRSVIDADLQPADPAAAKAAGFAIGFVGPHIATTRDDTTLVVDPDASIDTFWVTGANQPDHHVKHFHWQRDLLDALPEADAERSEASGTPAVHVADIRNAVAGDPAPEDRGGGTLQETKGIEVGHVFKLGDKYTRSLDVAVTDEDNQPQHPLMGCYGIGVNRILAAAIEQPPEDKPGDLPGAGGHDEDGIIWPAAIAPAHVHVVPIKYQGDVAAATDRLIEQLEAAGAEVLLDDRDERPGVKFKDADLLGLPLRVTLGDKGLSQDPPTLELKARDGSLGPRGTSIPLADAPARIVDLLHL